MKSDCVEGARVCVCANAFEWGGSRVIRDSDNVCRCVNGGGEGYGSVVNWKEPSQGAGRGGAPL